MQHKMNEYTIQSWLFDEAEGRFDVDLAESGIQYHYFHDLDLSKNYDLNYSLDRGKYASRERVANMYGVSVDNVAITHGSQEGLYLFYRSMLDPGDHVIVFTPGWQQSWEVPRVIGCDITPIALSAENGYQIDCDAIQEAIRPNTKLIVINNPCNPTGVAVEEGFYAKLNAAIDASKASDVFIICDEEYFTDYPKSAIHQGRNIGVTSSLSKVHGYPGLRFGWFIGPKEVVEKVVNYKRYVTVSNSSLCEALAGQVLDNYTYFIEYYTKLVERGYRQIQTWASSQDGVEVIRPNGTSFAYLPLDIGMSSFEFSRQLLHDEKVLVMPAEVFDDRDAIRISIGRSDAILKEGFSRISRVLDTVGVK